MPRNKNRGGGSRSDQPMFSGWTDTAKDSPFATAAVAAAAVGAGVFLWNRRNQISGQLSNLSDQISDWTANMRSGTETGEFETAGATGTNRSAANTASTGTTRSTGRARGTGPRAVTGTTARGRGRTTRGMSETGGGNASLGSHTGSGRGVDEL